MAKIAWLTYHKNIDKIYEKKWIDEYRHSVLNQTYKDFAIFEMNYGGGNERIFENSFFESLEMPSFVHALNYLLDQCFSYGYDYVANSNVDDVYTLDRIEKQLPYLKSGYEVVAANFSLVKNDSVIKKHKFHNLDIKMELSHNHNILCHPLIFYSAAFWKRHRYVPEQTPLEDLMLWQRAIKDSRIIILEDNLLFHRLHDESVCKSDNR